MPGPMRGDVREQFAHGVKLMKARKNESFLRSELNAAVFLRLLFLRRLQVDKLLQNIRHALFLKDVLPKVRRRVAGLIRRIPLPAVPTGARAALIRGEKDRILPGSESGRIHRHETALPWLL